MLTPNLAPGPTTHQPPPPARPARPSLVIADDGQRADLLVLAARAAVGDRFEHRGLTWTVTGRRSGGRVLVAEPRGN